MIPAPPPSSGTADSPAVQPAPRARSRGPGGRAWLPAAAAMFASGWGANQFTPLLVVYRGAEHYSDVAVDAMFGAYVLGLVPGLLLSGPASDRWGRRRVVTRVTALAAAATAVLALGAVLPAALFVGRLLSGLAAGSALTAATTWVKELSCPPHGTAGAAVGAKRAALATTAGFGAGALVAGLLAQFAPLPTVLPYAAHLLVSVPVLAALRRAADTGGPAAPAARAGRASGLLRAVRVPAAAEKRFVRVVAPTAPWVFGAAAVAYAILPGRVTARIPDWAVAYTALVTALTLAVGVAVQPLARRLHRPGSARSAVLALGVVCAGMAVAADADARRSPTVLLAAAVLLGGGYGIALVAGLLEVQRLAGPGGLAALTGVYYALTYLGFLLPEVLAALAAGAGFRYPAMLVVLSGLALATAGWAAVFSRRHPRAERQGLAAAGGGAARSGG